MARIRAVATSGSGAEYRRQFVEADGRRRSGADYLHGTSVAGSDSVRATRRLQPHPTHGGQVGEHHVQPHQQVGARLKVVDDVGDPLGVVTDRGAVLGAPP